MTNASWEQLSAQCDRLMRNGVTLRNSQPGPTSWAWMGEEPPGTALGNLKQKIASLEEALATERRYSTDMQSVCCHPSLWQSPLVRALLKLWFRLASVSM